MVNTKLVDVLKSMGRIGGKAPQWHPHPRFAGVQLCPLVDAGDSANALTSLLVDLAAGAVMDMHCHEAQCEQHLVLQGEGRLRLDKADHSYSTGSLALIPQGVPHAIVAGNEGMVMLAVFSPA